MGSTTRSLLVQNQMHKLGSTTACERGQNVDFGANIIGKSESSPIVEWSYNQLYPQKDLSLYLNAHISRTHYIVKNLCTNYSVLIAVFMVQTTELIVQNSNHNCLNNLV